MGRYRRRMLRSEALSPRRMLAADTLLISEFLANNDSVLADSDGQFSDWIELHNASDGAIRLDGWSLTDDSTNLRKWSFPDKEVAAGEYFVVFASGQDRRDPQQPLHTSFRLSSAGEYLALVDPAGDIVQSFDPAYPPQSSDVSFGLPVEQVLLASNAHNGRYHVATATSEADQFTWQLPAFDDSSWQEAEGPIGYELRTGIINAGFETGDVSGWTATGSARVVSAVPGVVPTQGDRHLLLEATESSANRFTIESFLGLDRFAINDAYSGVYTFGSAIKRELTVEPGTVVQLDWNFLTDEPRVEGARDAAFLSITPGLGVFPLALPEDARDFSGTRFDRETGYRTFEYRFVEGGTFTIGLGVINEKNRFLNSGLLVDNLRIDGAGAIEDTFRPSLGSDIEAALANQSGSLWARYRFDIENPLQFDALVARLAYDDGVVLHINGQQAFRDSAPDSVAYDSLSVEPRRDQLALEPRLVALPVDLLRPGENVLAVQVLKESVDDPNLLLDAELIGIGTLSTEPAYFAEPTPGWPNLTDSRLIVQPVQFSLPHGFYDRPAQLLLTSATAGATIHYTTDGSLPTSQSPVYREPLTVDRSLVVRAVATRELMDPSPPETHTYIFLDDVVTQDRQQAIDRGFPSTWPDYDMDQRVIGRNGTDLFAGRYAETVRDDLQSVPTLSLVMEMDDLFGVKGILANPLERGIEWERPTSVELIYPDGRPGFQIDAGIRVQGGISRFIADKSSLRLLFKDEYGAAKLDFPLFGDNAASTFDSISLRSSSGEHLVGIHYIRDEFLRRSQLATGNAASHGTYMHLYINGLYWGLYNPVERIDDQFAVNYFGGETEQYDVLNAGDLGAEGVSAVSGSLETWNQTVALAREVQRARDEPAQTAAYLRLQGRNPDGSRNPDWEVFLDTDNYIDYLITNVYARNGDWPVRNYYMLRRRGLEGTGFKFFVWDAEFTLDQGMRESINRVTADGPGVLLDLLRTSEAFRVDFADRVQRHFSQGGAFYVNPENRSYTPDHPDDNRPADRYARLANEVRSPLVPETARWGDERARGGQLFTRDEQWLPVVNFNLATFFPNRSRVFLDDLRTNGFYRDAPRADAPQGLITPGSDVALETDTGVIYVTRDGSDPRLPDGRIAPTAFLYGGPIRIDSTTTLLARSLDDGRWSALAEATYYTDVVPASSGDLRITELHYAPHPRLVERAGPGADPEDLEWIEIANVAPYSVQLEGVRLEQRNGEGVTFQFGQQTLAAGESVVVVANPQAFRTAYGQPVQLARGTASDAQQWRFLGRLSDDGELLTLVDRDGHVIHQVTYDDDQPGLDRADGEGSSLLIADTLPNQIGPESMIVSRQFGGSPGSADLIPPAVRVNEVMASPAGAGEQDWIELYNSTDVAVSLSGWGLSDTNDDYFRYRIPAGTTIAPHGFWSVHRAELGYGLSGTRGETIFLVQSGDSGEPLAFVDQVSFDATPLGTTVGRWPDGQGILFPLSAATRGDANRSPVPPQVVISELQIQPEDLRGGGELTADQFEFVELFHAGQSPLDLNGWRVGGDIHFEFSATSVNPGDVLLLVPFDPIADGRQAALFRLFYGLSSTPTLVGPFTGTLSDNVAQVRLYRPLADAGQGEVLTDVVQYDLGNGWPDDVRGTGRSLQRNGPDQYGLMPDSWRSQSQTPAVAVFQSAPTGDVNGDGAIDVADLDLICSAIHAGEVASPFDLNQDGRVDLDDLDWLLRDVLASRAGDVNLDGRFDSKDLIRVFQAAEYEDDTPENSSWQEGDWNCDRDFTSADLIRAFQYGRFAADAR